MITGQQTIKHFALDVWPIKLAAASYKKWKSEKPFIDDLDDYLLHGLVISRPDIFGMARVIDIAPEGAPKPEPAWFVRIAVGDLRRLVLELPDLPKICFCRRGDSRMREYSLARLRHLATKQQEKEGSIWADHLASHNAI